MTAEVVPLVPRCVVCGGGMNCEFCPVPPEERRPVESPPVLVLVK